MLTWVLIGVALTVGTVFGRMLKVRKMKRATQDRTMIGDLLDQMMYMPVVAAITTTGDVGWGDRVDYKVTIITFDDEMKLRVAATNTGWIPDIVKGGAILDIPFLLRKKANRIAKECLASKWIDESTQKLLDA